MLLRAADGTLATLELFLNAQYGYTTRCEVVSEFGTTALPEPAALDVREERRQAVPKSLPIGVPASPTLTACNFRPGFQPSKRGACAARHG